MTEEPLSGADRSRRWRRRHGIRARTLSTDPYAVAQRKKRAGEPLTATDLEAIRTYHREAARRRRARKDTP